MNSAPIIMLIIMFITALLLLVVIARGRSAQQHPTRIAAREAYEHASAYAKAHQDDTKALMRVILLGRIAQYGDTLEDDDITARLRQLEDLHARGMIGDVEYTQRYRAILDDVAR
jgi:hypothetical protein